MLYDHEYRQVGRSSGCVNGWQVFAPTSWSPRPTPVALHEHPFKLPNLWLPEFKKKSCRSTNNPIFTQVALLRVGSR